MTLLRVSSKSKPNMIAGAIAGELHSCGATEIQTVGAGALNQAVKAVAIARNILASEGYEIACTPLFKYVYFDGLEKTAIRLVIESTKTMGCAI